MSEQADVAIILVERLGASASGAPGAMLDEACARAGLDKIKDRLK